MWSELEDAARDAQRARVFHNTPPYSAPAMYGKAFEMDMHGLRSFEDDYEGETSNPESKSTIFVNLELLGNELEKLHSHVDRLNSKLSPVMTPAPTADGNKKPPRESSNSVLADRISSLVLSVEELNVKVRSITSSVDL